MKKKEILIINAVFLILFACKKDLPIENYTIDYYTTHGITPESKTVEANYVLTEEDLPELTEKGYDFFGWDKYSGDIVTQDITITAYWNKLEYYNVTYSTEYGEEPESLYVPKDYKLTKEDLPNLQDDSYTFDGWDYPVGYAVRDDITITASWKDLVYYTITYVSAHGDKIESKKVLQDYEITAEDLPELEEQGYVFGGWDTNFGTKVTKDITITAIWAVGTGTEYKIEYYLQKTDLKTYELKDIETKKGITNATTSVIPKVYDGFVPLDIEQKVIFPDGKTVVKVFYDRKTIILTINLNGGKTETTLKNGTISGPYGTNVVLKAPQKSGFELKGWNDPLVELPTTFPLENEIFTAVWNDVNPPEVFNISASSWYGDSWTDDNTYTEIKWTNPNVDDFEKVIITSVHGKRYEIYGYGGMEDSIRLSEKGMQLDYYNIVSFDEGGNKSEGVNAGVFQGECSQKLYECLEDKLHTLDPNFYDVVIIPKNTIEVFKCTDEIDTKIFNVGDKFKLSSFTMSNLQITNALADKILEDDPYNISISDGNYYFDWLLKPDDTVHTLTWYDAVYFCNCLSKKLGLEPYYEITNIETGYDKVVGFKENTKNLDYVKNEAKNSITKADVKISTKPNARYGYRLPTMTEWELAERGIIPGGEKQWNTNKNEGDETPLYRKRAGKSNQWEICFDSYDCFDFSACLEDGYFVDPVALSDSTDKVNRYYAGLSQYDRASEEQNTTFRVARYQEED